MRYILLSAFGLGCASDKAITTYNNPPTASITSHSDGAELYEGATINLIGQVSDTNHSESDLLVQWSTDVRNLCEETAAGADGAVSCQTSLEEGEQEIRLQVIDPEGEAAIAVHNITVIPTQAPNVEIISPVIGGSYYSDQLILFSALITDAEDDVDELTYTWNSNLDGDLPITAPLDADGMVSQYLNLSEGQHAISLVAEDSTGKRSTQTVAITVGGINQEPTCDILSPESGSAAVEGESIEFGGFASDEDISNSQLDIVWTSSIDGTFNTANADTDGGIAFSYNGLSKGSHTISLQVYDDVEAMCQKSIQLEVGSPPSIEITTPITTSVYSLGENILFEGTVSDAEDIPSAIAVEWVSSEDGVFSTQGADSSGTLTLPYSSLSAGIHSIIITAEDSSGLSTTTSLSLTINTPPSAPSVSINPTTPYTGNDLEAIVISGGDPDGDPVSHQFAWYNNGSITSYTSAILPSSATNYGEIWTVRVTPNDGYTDGTYTEESIEIANTAPSVDSIVISPDPAYNDDVLICTATASDADQTVTPTYMWMVGTASYSGSTLDVSTLGVSPTQSIMCTASVTDDAGVQSSDSLSLSLSNRNPIIANEQLSPTSIGNTSIVECSADVSDPDGETPSLTFEWSQNGTVLASGSSIDLSTYSIQVGDIVTCTLEATDGYGGQISTSVSSSVTNAAPQITALELTPDPMYTDSILTATGTATDPEGDAISYQYEWFVNSTSVQNGSTPTLDSSFFSKGNVVQVTLTVNDAYGTGIPQSTSQTCQNTAPGAPTLTLSPGAPVEQVDDLICTIDTPASDLDGDSLSYTFSWTQNGSAFTNTSSTSASSTVPAIATSSSDVFVCSVDTYDGTDYASTVSSSITINGEWAGAITFTPCGGTGYLGPSQSMCDGEYSGTLLDGQVSVSNGIQEWVVPSTGQYTFEVAGARGGTDGSTNGAIINGTLTLTAGDVLHIVVGQQGEYLTGGGGSFVVDSNGNIPLIIAGGGGGCFSSCPAGVETQGRVEESGGTSGSQSRATSGNGGGRSNSTSGAGGGFYGDGAGSGNEGQSFLNGAQGGVGESGKVGGFGGGGARGGSWGQGGGGGYSGGSCGDQSNTWQGCGGGGSYNSGTNNSGVAGSNASDGYIIIDTP